MLPNTRHFYKTRAEILKTCKHRESALAFVAKYGRLQFRPISQLKSSPSVSWFTEYFTTFSFASQSVQLSRPQTYSSTIAMHIEHYKFHDFLVM